MSPVTSIVFVTGSHRQAKRFADLIEDLYDGFDYLKFRPEPVDDNGPLPAGTIVFHIGLNAVTPELFAALRKEPWPPNTVLWMWSEDAEQPEILAAVP